MSPDNSLLIVGSVALDSVETPFGKVEDELGGSAVYSGVSSSYFTEAKIVGVIGEDFPQKYISLLKKYKIDLQGLKTFPGKTFRWVGHYMYDLNCAHTIETQLNVFEKFNPELPEEYRSTKFIFLANIDPELQYSVFCQIKNPLIVACDTMNYWIEHKNKELKKVLKIVDILLINEAELRQLTGITNIVKSAKTVLKLGPKIVIVKRGEYGSMCFYKNHIFVVPSYPLEDVFDPTGAGDSFAGGFLGYIAKCGKLNDTILRQAIIFGNVMGSFCIEEFGVRKFLKITYRDIVQRYKKIKNIVHFEDINE